MKVLVESKRETMKIENRDCAALMPEYPSGYFDLAIADPPYGIGKTWNKDVLSKFYHHNSSYTGKKINDKFFNELFRVSRNQIIFGANYYIKQLPAEGSWIVWDKMRTDKIRSGFELAWTSIHKSNKIARFVWDGFKCCSPRYGFHPHEKPVKLYEWLLVNYAKSGWKIFDPFMGSGTIAIACHNLGFDLIACEIDTGYYTQAMKIINKHIEQQTLFTPREIYIDNPFIFNEAG
jgi:site-specific DNA-methyltransferase (adenine-specific)